MLLGSGMPISCQKRCAPGQFRAMFGSIAPAFSQFQTTPGRRRATFSSIAPAFGQFWATLGSIIPALGQRQATFSSVVPTLCQHRAILSSIARASSLVFWKNYPPLVFSHLPAHGESKASPHTYQAKDGYQAFCSQRVCDPRLVLQASLHPAGRLRTDRRLWRRAGVADPFRARKSGQGGLFSE